MNGSATSANLSGLSVPQLASLLAAPARWEILQELSKGEALPVAELAQRTGRTAAATGKNLRLLRQLGVAVVGFGRLYSLAPALRPPSGAATTLDLGRCVLRFDPAPADEQ